MISNKAQTQQVFVYILTVVIIGLIFVFGFRAVNYFINKGEQVSYIKFKTDLSDKVRIMGPKYGTVDRQEFIVGGDYTEVCFVDGKATIAGAGHPIMTNLVQSGVKENMFLFAGESPEKEYIGKIEVIGDYFCPKIRQGKLRLQFEGLGNRTLITEWPYS
jgi:hypothetical protein